QLRPCYRDLSLWQKLRVPTREFATPLARVGMFRIWSTVEDVTVRVGGPRTGKTGELACRVVDAPGAVIATSTRTDLIELTGPVRKQVGPVNVFNPAGVGGLESSITFDPLSGCQVPKVAMTRAADLLSGVSAPGGDGEREFWEGQARRALAALMHAAALGGRSMRDVQGWVANPNEAARDVTKFLHRSPEPSTMTDAAQFLATNDRTRSSICSTIMPALGWLADPIAAAAAESGVFDVERLLTERGTVYMLGAEDAQTAPLVTALTGHIAREARRIAGNKRSGRLDPPLTLALDEAALICPIPLDNWTADMGGRGVTIHIAAQSRAQLRQRWGDNGAAAILNNAATLLIFGGTRDPEDLNAYATLTGERDEQVPTFDQWGEVRGRSVRRVPVLTAAQIAQLKERRVVIIRRGMPAAVGKVQMAWQRREVKAARRREQWAERIERFDEWRERFAVKFGRAVDTAAVWLDKRRARRNTQPEQQRERVHAVQDPYSSHGENGGEHR
ncbi:MAG: TraM recognition domain-containing protein, partial [Actinophytocola sp.]|nr:TraM recognition domain-containing protein [Actinophytocola sp.]